jgi:hypothetical protein
MPLKNKNWCWGLTLGYCLSVLIIGLGLSQGIHRLPDVSQPSVEKEVWFYGDKTISQKVEPLHNGFNVVQVYLRNIALRNREPVTFSLGDTTGKELRRIDLNGYNIGDGDNVRLQFTPLTDSKGKTYRLVFSSPSSVWENAVGVGYSGPEYPGGSIAYSLYYNPVSRLEVIKTVTFRLVGLVARPSFLFYLILVFIFTWFPIKKMYRV